MDFQDSGRHREPAVARSVSQDGQASRQLYEVPTDLTPGQKFEHWRDWYGQALNTPVRLEATVPVSPLFSPSAASFTGPDFSVIELRNEPASAIWNANPDLDDVRLAYFVKAEAATYNFSGTQTSISAPRVRFLDLTRDGAFHAPHGMHVIQLNLRKSSLDIDAAAFKRLADVPNLIQHPILRALVMPVLLNCRHAGMEAHAGATSRVLKSSIASLIASVLEVPAEPEALEPAQLLAIRQYIHGNYASQDLAVKAVADQFHMSHRALYYLFEDECLGVGARIRTLRTIRALALLLDKDLRHAPIEEIAERSGFSNTQGLRRALKDATGMTARDLRANPVRISVYLRDLQQSLTK